MIDQIRPGHKDMQSTGSVDQIYLGHPNLFKIISQWDGVDGMEDTDTDKADTDGTNGIENPDTSTTSTNRVDGVDKVGDPDTSIESTDGADEVDGVEDYDISPVQVIAKED